MAIGHSLVHVSSFGALYDLNLVVQVSSLRLYADGTTTHASDTITSALELSLIRNLHKLLSWLSSNYLSVNHSKTQAMILGNSSQEPALHIGDSTIEVTDYLKILGIHVANKVSFKVHISAVLKKVYARIEALRRLKNLVPSMLHFSYTRPTSSPIQNTVALSSWESTKHYLKTWIC